MPEANGNLVGFDTAAGPAAIVASLTRIKAAKQDFVVGYYGHGGKVMSPAAARLLSDAGLDLVMVFEGNPTHAGYFTAAQGQADAELAVKQAVALGQPFGTPICATVDYDASNADIAGPIHLYMAAYSYTLRFCKYLPGVYGNGAVCAAMLDASFASFAFVWGAHGTNDTLNFIASNRWHLMQSPTVSAANNRLGFDDDPDIGKASGFGGFRVLPTIVTPSPAPVLVIPPAKAMQAALGVMADGVWGPASAAALAAYYVR